jgi:hypothetical protein
MPVIYYYSYNFYDHIDFFYSALVSIAILSNFFPAPVCLAPDVYHEQILGTDILFNGLPV